MSVPKKITTALPKPSEIELARLVHQLNDADARLRKLLGDRVDAVLSATGETFLLRQAQERLLHSEAMLANAQSIAKFGSWEIELADLQHLDRNKLTWSDEVFRIFGYQPGQIEVNSDAFFRSVHPDDVAAIKAATERALRERTNYSINHRIILPNGDIRHVYEKARLILDPESHRPMKMVGIVQDVTAQHEKEEQLRLSEARFTGAFENAAIGMALVSPEGTWLKVNRAICELVGYTEEELLQLTFQDITFPEDLAPDLDLVQQTLEGKIDRYQLEKRYRHKDGHLVWVLLAVSLVRDSEKRPLYFVSQIQDITERKVAEQQLKEQAALINHARDAIILRDLENVVIFWNKGAERLYGWSEAETVGRSTLELMYRPSAKFQEANFAVQSTDSWNGELESHTKSGNPLITECRWTLLRDADGQPKAVLCINTDVTEQKKIESQFLRAQRMESIGTLAGGIAHDLNNLLAPILMGVDLLKHFGLSPKSLEVVQGIERSAKRGSNLVKQVLSFARGVEGSRVSVHFADIIKEFTFISANTFPKNITVETKVPEDLWLVMGDPTQLSQVVLNIALNARDAMPDGGALSISAENAFLDSQQAVSPGRYVRIDITDTGAGISPENLEKIFDPFFTTKELSKGTGLGLATTQSIVRSHGGFITVTSEIGRGSSFRIFLPAQREDALSLSHQAEGVDWPRGNGEWILLVDDETSILTITKQTLEAFGYTVITAEHGAQAISVFAVHHDKIAVVMTDMMMPVMDGPATIIALRQLKPDVKIIAASGLNSTGGVSRAAQAGAQHFLAKPYATGTMLITLRAVLLETS